MMYAHPEGDPKYLRNQWMLMNSIALFAIVTGVTVWFSTPFFTRDRDNEWHRRLRYLSISYALLSGTIALACSNVLASSRSEYEALIKAEKARRKHAIASELYLAQKTNTAIAQALIGHRQQELGLQPVTVETEESQEVPESSESSVDREHKKLPGTGTGTGTTEPEITLELVERVAISLADNRPDSEIIKNVIGMSGRNYQQGKIILDRIKRIIEDEVDTQDEN